MKTPMARLRGRACTIAALAIGIAVVSGAQYGVRPAAAQTTTARCTLTSANFCLVFQSAVNSNQLDESTSGASQRAVSTSASPHIGSWRVVYPTIADMDTGNFEVRSPDTGWCLTDQGPNTALITEACSTDRGSDLFMRQLWTFVQGTNTHGDGTRSWELVSVADGGCVDQIPGAGAYTWSCSGQNDQQWWIGNGLSTPSRPDYAMYGSNDANAIATAKNMVSIDARVSITSLLSGTALDVGGEPDAVSSDPVISSSPSIDHWDVAFGPDGDRRDGSFMLVDDRNGQSRCLTELDSTDQVLHMQPCADLAGSSIDQRQHFYLVETGDRGQFEIVSESDHRCLDALEGHTESGSVVGVSTCNGADEQLWRLSDRGADPQDGTTPNQRGVTIGETLAGDLTAHDPSVVTISSDYDSQLLDLWNNDAGYPNEAVTNNASEAAHDQFTILYQTDADRSAGYFHLVNEDTGRCLDATSNPDDQVFMDTCATSEGTDADDRQLWYLTRQDGNIQLRSKYDGRCAGVDGAPNLEADLVTMSACGVASPKNQAWTFHGAPGSGGAWPGDVNAFVTSAISNHAEGVVAAAKAKDSTSTIQFCNHGAFLAEGAIMSEKDYTGVDDATQTQQGLWTTPILATGQCSTYTVPAGVGFYGFINLNEFTNYYMANYGWTLPPDTHGAAGTTDPWTGFWTQGHDNDKIITEFDYAAPYTNVVFNFYGTTCNPTYSIDHQDQLSAVSAVADGNDFASGCADDSNVATVSTELGDDIDDAWDGFTEILQWIGDLAIE